MFTDSCWIEDWVHPSPGSPYSLNTLYCSRGATCAAVIPKSFHSPARSALIWRPSSGTSYFYIYRRTHPRLSPSQGPQGMDQGFHPDGGSPDTDPGEQLNVEGQHAWQLEFRAPLGRPFRLDGESLLAACIRRPLDALFRLSLEGRTLRGWRHGSPKTASCRKSWQNCSIQRIRPARSIGTMCLLSMCRFPHATTISTTISTAVGRELGNGHRKSVLYLSYI